MQISPAEFVIGKLGGLTKTARACGRPVSTVQGWKDRGRIPPDHWKPLMEAIEADGGEIDFPDFINPHPSVGVAQP